MRIAPAFNVTPMSAAGAGGLGTMGAAIMQAPEFQQQLTKARFANPMALQALLQQITKTRFLPGQQQADIFAKESPALTQMALHPIINNSIAGEIQNLMKFNPNDPLGAMYAQNFLNSITQSGTPGGGMPQVGQQPGVTSFRGQPTSAGQPSQPSESPGVSGSQIAQHMKAQMAGIAHPGQATEAASRVSALQSLNNLLPTLKKLAPQEGGLEGHIGTLLSTTNSTKYNSALNKARDFAQKAGLPTSPYERSWTGSEAASKLKGQDKYIQDQIKFRQQQAKAFASGKAISGAGGGVPLNTQGAQSTTMQQQLPKNIQEFAKNYKNTLSGAGFSSKELQALQKGEAQLGNDGYVYKYQNGKLLRKKLP